MLNFIYGTHCKHYTYTYTKHTIRIIRIRISRVSFHSGPLSYYRVPSHNTVEDTTVFLCGGAIILYQHNKIMKYTCNF